MKPYAEYKPTGLNWLPEVPAHWVALKFKYLFAERSEKGYPEEPLLAATQNHGVILKSDYENRTVTAEKDLQNLKLVRVGDFVISLRSFEGGIELAHNQGIISPAYTILTTRGSLSVGYFKWLGKSAPFIQLLKSCVTGIREGQNIDYGRLRVVEMPVPPPDEQAKIVAYLDAKTAKIDRLIKVRERFIELKKEELNLLLFDESGSRTVFGAWNDAFPKYWKREKMRHLFVERNQKGFRDKELLAVSQMEGVIFKKDAEANYVCASDYATQKLVCVNDYVISLRAFQGGVETSYVEGLVSASYNVFYMKKFDKELHSYYRYLLKSPIFILYLNTLVQDMRDGKNIRFRDIRDCLVPIPPREHVKKIIMLGDEIKSHEAFLAKERKLLKEYRTRLISDAVTGRIDLREVS